MKTYRWAVCIAVAVAVLAGTAGASASATAEQEPPASGALPEAGSPDPALATLDREAGVMQQEARNLSPDGYAGLWIERNPTYAVHVAYTSGADEFVANLRGRHPTLPLVAETRAVGLAHLEDIQSRLVAQRAPLRSNASTATESPKALRDTGGLYDVDIDVRKNVVTLINPDVDEGTATQLRSSYGDSIQVLRAPLTTRTACASDAACNPAMLGGLQINGNNGAGCTSAFLVQDGNGLRRRLTAGHCGLVGVNWEHNFTQYGVGNVRVFAGNTDAQILAPNGAFQESSKVFLDGGAYLEPSGLRSWANTAVGATMCHQGRTTGRSCGVVSTRTHAPGGPDYPAGSINYIMFNACVDHGDSGGPVYAPNGDAAGITSGFFNGPGFLCNAGTRTAGIQNANTVYSALDFALNNLGVNLVFNVNVKPSVGYSRSCTVLMQCTFNGFGNDPDGSIVSWFWNFGNGSTASGQNVTYTYPLPGNKTVGLTVTDNSGGQSYTSQTFLVL